MAALVKASLPWCFVLAYATSLPSDENDFIGVRRAANTVSKHTEAEDSVMIEMTGNVRRAANKVPFRAPSKKDATKTALLIHSGVMRGYKNLWPIWEKNFIKPSEAAGVRFTIAVSTDLQAFCDPDAPDAWNKDVGEGHWTRNRCACASHSNDTACSHHYDVASEEDKARFAREIQMIYGPSSKGGHVHVHHVHEMDDLPQKRFNSVYTRAMPILKMYENQTFDYIIVTRPDIVLVDAGNFSNADQEFNLVSMCDSHPGLNLVDGFFTRPDDVHYRDWDWGYMLCDGKHKENAKAVLFGNCGPCGARLEQARLAGVDCVPPSRSSEFVSRSLEEWRAKEFIPGKKGHFSCESRACSWFEGMEGKMRFGTLDDTLFGYWPQNLPRFLEVSRDTELSLSVMDHVGS